MINITDNRLCVLILKLRSNIKLEGDLQLAVLEVEKLLNAKPEPLSVEDLQCLVEEGMLREADLRHLRTNGVVGYRVNARLFDPKLLFQRLSFVELVSGSIQTAGANVDDVMDSIAAVPSQFVETNIRKDMLQFRLVPLNTVFEWSDVIAKGAANAETAISALERAIVMAREGQEPTRKDALAEKAMGARLTTGHLFHGLHVYKAKFFPRMVRALLNVHSPQLDSHVLDPYAGSGTALAEASVMGMQSVGVDIDPLSAMIAEAKAELLHNTRGDYDRYIREVKDTLTLSTTGQPSLFQKHNDSTTASAIIPPFLVRRIPEETQREISKDISSILAAISSVPDTHSLPLKIALSDAISRKLKFRFLGLGFGRFSLNIMTGRIIDMFRSNLNYLSNSITVWRWLQETAEIAPAATSVRLGDARELPLEEDTFDFVITSPPYMPASSGRENYLKSKALAMTALGLIDAADIDTYEQTQVGSVHREFHDLDELSPMAREIVDWMASDEMRKVKAASTASYFIDLAHSLREIRRVLRPGGCCAMVVARSHTFYTYKSRDIVRIVEIAEIVSELATRCGLEVVDAIHVELAKQNAVARPRSLDAYYETVLIFKKPVSTEYPILGEYIETQPQSSVLRASNLVVH